MPEETKNETTQSQEQVKVPEKFQELVKKIEELSVLDLAELVKVLEEKFGVSAQPAAVAGMAVSAGAAGAEAGAAAAEKTDFAVELASAGDSKIAVIKAVKEITGIGLKEAKDIVEAAPKVIKEKAPKAEAEEIKKKLEEAGATVNLK